MKKSNVDMVKLFSALSVFAGLVWTMLASVDAVPWDEGETLLVTAVSTAFFAAATAIYAHFRKETTSEAPAVQASVTALVSSVLFLLVGFEYVHWTDLQIAVIMSAVNGAFLVIGVFYVRRQVTPVPKGYPFNGPAIEGQNLAGWTDGAVNQGGGNG